ncbi:hypothetical protein BAJUN_00610 [Bajunvirus bajun]|uniref:Uncharacterized protein n=1 Tax=Brevundimonas phage vB_BgoS-Bajun TaxID=2948594 RepID=A0A9E7ST77_9CAUD|nr:hypothetical protein BAJUN_00610 [Brevundimonas phage vB_BgoS-Bajun]
MTDVTSPRPVDRRSYSVRFMHPNLPGTGRQTTVAVYTTSQKQAAELMTVAVKELQTYGGSGGSIVGPLLRKYPDTAFVSLDQHDLTWITLDKLIAGAWEPSDVFDISEERAKHFDEMMGDKIESPAFGTVSINRISGSRNLFMVDYPVDSFIRITFKTAELRQRSGHDTVFSDREVASVDLSEVQFARLIASPNTMGTPCTYHNYRDPLSGEFLSPIIPDRHVADGETFRKAIEDKARTAMAKVTEAHAILSEAMKGGSIRKGDIQKALDTLAGAQREGVANLAYVVHSAHETIDTAIEHGKANFDAHVDFSLTRLGREALGERIQAAIESGTDFRDVGRHVLTVMAPTDTPSLDDNQKET